MVHTFSTFIPDLESSIINHPVHILTKDNKLSPSAFIPFCDFGGNMSAMGIKIDQFDVPVCNSFQAKILNDQLCYEVDLNKFSVNIERELKTGFTFVMDYNVDRQISFKEMIPAKKHFSLGNIVAKSDNFYHAFIYLDTIGK